MTGKNIMKLFCWGFVLGAVGLGFHFIFAIKKSPENMPFDSYRVLRLCEYFSLLPLDNKSESYRAAHPEKYPVETTDYYKTQYIIGEDDPVQRINVEDIIKDGTEIDAPRAVYAIDSGTVIRMTSQGVYYRITIDSGNGQCPIEYPPLLDISPIEKGDRVEGGYYLGEAEMSQEELGSALRKINSQLGYRVVPADTTE